MAGAIKTGLVGFVLLLVLGNSWGSFSTFFFVVAFVWLVGSLIVGGALSALEEPVRPGEKGLSRKEREGLRLEREKKEEKEERDRQEAKEKRERDEEQFARLAQTLMAQGGATGKNITIKGRLHGADIEISSAYDARAEAEIKRVDQEQKLLDGLRQERW